jgi:hypothetical protein
VCGASFFTSALPKPTAVSSTLLLLTHTGNYAIVVVCLLRRDRDATATATA